ncbi:MAG: NAD(P)-dependent oxidoreductase [Rhizobiales bacterium TMED83]|nr:oxidoreductase [Rhodobiaceae bacterium]RPF94572.1 MAG: NAD(P)-dependent oxidoreductase [Rhizobiales bacterium TMED83]
MRVAFIGLGVMGYPMAGHLAKAGLDVVVYNRTRAKAEAWVDAHNGQLASTPAAAAKGASMVFACVGNDADLNAVITGDDGAAAGMDAGALLIDHTTTSADIARNLSARLAEQDCYMLDAPVSGGQAGAENAALTIMVGGPQNIFDTARPVLMHYARAVRLMGPTGAGQLTKMVNQICIGGLLQSLSEALVFCEKAGLDGRAVVDVISKGAAQSWQMENRFETMIDNRFDFGFAVDWMIKDLDICLVEAERNGADLPITQIIRDYYGDVREMGGGRWDTSSLIARLRRK